jgi:DNA polymerase-3 subunit delta'
VGTALHPWNAERAERLWRERAQLPHALLLAGPRGLGKNTFAEWLAQSLLCAAPANLEPCGHCQSCLLFSAGSHPDLHVVQPEARYKADADLLARYARRYPPEDKGKESKDSTVIRIDQIRALIANSQTRPQIARCKVLILSPADSLNVNAANSLLKLLEEPPADSYLLLVADRPAQLPATVRSRCVRLEFTPPASNVACAWLEAQGLVAADAELLLGLAGGAPLAAQELGASDFLAQRLSLQADLEALAAGKGDPLACAARWKALGAERCLDWLQGWLADLAALRLRAVPGRLRNPELPTRLQDLEKRLNLKQLFEFTAAVAESRRLLGGPLDEQLLLEDILIRWTELHAAFA